MDSATNGSQLSVGYAVPESTWKPSTLTIFLFSAAAWAPHRLHYDAEFAKEQGHDSVVVQGPLLGAYMLQMVSRWAQARGGRVSRIKFSNRAAAYPNEELVGRAIVNADNGGPEGRILTFDISIGPADTDAPRKAAGVVDVILPASSE